jgi:hypothetical protein
VLTLALLNLLDITSTICTVHAILDKKKTLYKGWHLEVVTMRSILPDLRSPPSSMSKSKPCKRLLVSHLTHSSAPKVKKYVPLKLQALSEPYHITTRKAVLILYRICGYVRYLSEYQAPHEQPQEEIEKKNKMFEWQPCYFTLTKEKVINTVPYFWNIISWSYKQWQST